MSDELKPVLTACALCLCLGLGISHFVPFGIPASGVAPANAADFWSMITATATVLVAGVGWSQLRQLNADARVGRTLETAQRYVHDAVLGQGLRKLDEGLSSGRLADHPEEYKAEIINLLNYLDGVAIGVEEGIFDETTARRFLQTILIRHCEEFLNAALLRKINLTLADYRSLSQVYARWLKLPVPGRKEEAL